MHGFIDLSGREVKNVSLSPRAMCTPLRNIGSHRDILEAHSHRSNRGVIYASSGIRKRDGSAEYWASYSRRKSYPGGCSLTPLELASPPRYDPESSTYTP